MVTTKTMAFAAFVLICVAAVVFVVAALRPFGPLNLNLDTLLNPPQSLTLASILLISFVLGIMHGATPDEHTWPITFSYAIGSYSTRKGMKAGFVFSSGFMLQRALLTTLGFLGLAYFYKAYNLDGPVYFVVGIVMLIAGIYILRKTVYLHLPIDRLLGGLHHHSAQAERHPLHEASEMRSIPLRMAFGHGLIAGFGFGAYATIITFVLAPQVPGLIYAPLPGLFFGLGTMVMQIAFGALFANFARVKHLTERQVSLIGKSTAGRTLLYGGVLFAVIGALIAFFPAIDNFAISTGNPIPNLDSLNVATFLVLGVVGIVGIGSLIQGIREALSSTTPAKRR